MVDNRGLDRSELALSALAVPSVRHALPHKANEFTSFKKTLSLCTSADTVPIHENTRHLHAMHKTSI